MNNDSNSFVNDIETGCTLQCFAGGDNIEILIIIVKIYYHNNQMVICYQFNLVGDKVLYAPRQ